MGWVFLTNLLQNTYSNCDWSALKQKVKRLKLFLFHFDPLTLYTKIRQWFFFSSCFNPQEQKHQAIGNKANAAGEDLSFTWAGSRLQKVLICMSSVSIHDAKSALKEVLFTAVEEVLWWSCPLGQQKSTFPHRIKEKKVAVQEIIKILRHMGKRRSVLR